ncbi:SAM-dependent methyltransferase [Acidaminobacter hydrogenoformans]|uniref:Methyltransferase domain-containing protein n=1 Tax=Acidaminobacter hydrogenoformans DSM 2784 TaxID=1120920 RepID=A0A1G5S725_9FIRM|nr:class I SAM-dependent methyltransferase [Acidaminobacter hydrogenoformans]SCZ81389.1 Methyltransferase domain-containing protein [Acidaminobacter hydrogenoformans DSM 2784]
MTSNVYKIRDICRRNLVKYTLETLSLIPGIDDFSVLDMGCGTGESVLALLGNLKCRVVAIDSDTGCVSTLNEKVNVLRLENRIKVIHGSVFDQNLIYEQFDLVMAEGLLNIIGFETGLALMLKYLKQSGVLLIHDQLENDEEKRILFKKYALKVISTLELNETIWWNEYYGCLESYLSTGEVSSFTKEINEISEYKKNPEKNRSIIYLLGYGNLRTIDNRRNLEMSKG